MGDEWLQSIDNLDGFCNDPFWDLDLTWYNSWPQFTNCFQSTALVWLPCGFLWLCAPLYSWYLAIHPSVASGHTFTRLLVLKLTFLSLLIVLSAVDGINVANDKYKAGGEFLRADFFEPVILTLTLILAFVFDVAERRKRFVTSGVLFLFWLFLVVCSIVKFYTFIQLEEYEVDVYRFSSFYTQFFFYLMEFFLHCFSEKPVLLFSPLKKPSPEIGASFPSRLSFWWMNGMMLHGYRQPLTESVMPDLHPRDKCQTVVPRFLKRWTRALRSYKSRQVRVPARRPSSGIHINPNFKGSAINTEDTNEQTPMLGSSSASHSYTDEKTELKEKKKYTGPSLFWILFKTFWLEYLLSQIWKLIYDILILTNPLILGQLVEFVQDQKREAWHGYVLGATLFISTIVQATLFHQVFHLSTSLGLRLRASVISSVFRKALTMDNLARKESTVGEVVNLMSVDAERIESVMIYIWAIWSSPLQIMLSLYLLYNVLGVSMFAGAAFLFLLIPANGFITAKLGSIETQVMAFKDERLKVMNELLSGIKIIKLFAWEKSFQKRVSDIRDKELAKIRSTAILGSVLTFSWTAAPFVVSLLTFTCYVYVSDNHHLDPKTAFVAISLFDILRYAINFAPMIVTDIVRAVISARRIGRFLCHDDLDVNNVSHFTQTDFPICIERGNFRWSSEVGTTLKNINLKVKDGSLVAVVGTVGSGKSSLLSAMLGDMEKLEGTVNVRGQVAYVSQQAWIQNDTVRNNILFGKPMNQKFYNQCVDACALRPDLDILSAGDLTEIGERGINLSGGQKQRVSLARAVYAEADIYLLDDPLSAVDSHVGRHIFESVISDRGMLAEKVRILVTHGIQYLPRTDEVIVITEGRISEAGRYDSLLTHNGPFAKFITTFLIQKEDNENANNDEIRELKQEMLREISEAETEEDEDNHITDIFKQLSATITEKKEQPKEETVDETLKRQRSLQENLIEEETVGTGQVKLSVYKEYGRSVGFFYVGVIILMYALYTGADMAALIFLSSWTDDPDLGNFTKWPSNSSERMDENGFYVGIYGMFGVLQTVFIIGFSLTESLRAVHASRVLHRSMLSRILRAPMAFFDTTPVGRIINRFSKDMDDVDENIPLTFLMWLDCVFMVGSVIIVISYSTPIFLPFILPVGILYYFVQRFYIATSRQLKRLGSKTRSPIYNHFNETLTGASIIRAFNAEKRFVQESEHKVDSNQIFMFTNYCVNRWLGFRLEFVGNLVILIAATIAVATRDAITGGIMGLSINYALQITENLNWLVRMTSDLETQIVSVERIKEYTEISSEAEWENFSHRSPPRWPSDGFVQVEDLSLRYRDGLDLVLKGVSFEVQPGEKVGIAGRTGAGKSSLTLALFRLAEPAGGRILIDGVDISTLGLHDLRSKVTILPQDPVIFAGTLRQNLDPFEEYTSDSIWTALDHVHLRSFVEGLPSQLDYECGEGGENLSVGQKQLICLGRALLRKTKILVLDEATAAVDMETDELIQTTIRKEFSDCTILTIAHRLNTVMDYDRILVLDKGQVKEFETPQKLLQDTDSLFHGMAKSAGLVS